MTLVKNRLAAAVCESAEKEDASWLHKSLALSELRELIEALCETMCWVSLWLLDLTTARQSGKAGWTSSSTFLSPHITAWTLPRQAINLERYSAARLRVPCARVSPFSFFRALP